MLAAMERVHFANVAPPQKPPQRLLSAYTRCGSIPIMYKDGNVELYVDDTRGGKGVSPKYAKAQILQAVEVAKKVQSKRRGCTEIMKAVDRPQVHSCRNCGKSRTQSVYHPATVSDAVCP